MPPIAYGRLAVGLVLAQSILGCAQARHVAFKPAEVPTGSWKGQGSFMAWQTTQVSDSHADPNQRSQGKLDGYETTLDISEVAVFKKRAVKIEILSKRGRIFGSEETETHLHVLLMPIEAQADGTTLYAVGDLQLNPKAPPDYTQREKTIRSQMRIPSATCVSMDGEICLQVHYLLPTGKAGWVYKDTFVFSGPCVTKTGSYVSRNQEEDKPKPGQTTTKTSQITWTERLVKTP